MKQNAMNPPARENAEAPRADDALQHDHASAWGISVYPVYLPDGVAESILKTRSSIEPGFGNGRTRPR